ncbi:Lsr2 protein [Pseudonocardia kunmingensis]|uniref:Lsr2 protein n=1 Tax=Pseudonocardia kunmingensis TaxID=630975 RepID=A0A543DQR9_9PSEU|nr:Lsr2 family protein [Pseudonocardia kunmingensis]TQM11671.1 Lsr2 protein [Pseudonocardia kunmingensis]
MAQKVTVMLVDDLDGTRASDTVAFGLDGRSYEIDLSEANAAKLRDTMAVYAAAGRRTGGRARRATAPDTTQNGAAESSTAATPAADRARTAAIREWAREAGLDVSTRGRIPNSVTEAYDNREARPATSDPAPAPAPAPKKKPRRLEKVADPFNPEAATA